MSPTIQVLSLLVVLAGVISYYFVIILLARQAIQREIEQAGGRVISVRQRPSKAAGIVFHVVFRVGNDCQLKAQCGLYRHKLYWSALHVDIKRHRREAWQWTYDDVLSMVVLVIDNLHHPFSQVRKQALKDLSAQRMHTPRLQMVVGDLASYDTDDTVRQLVNETLRKMSKYS